MELPAAAQLLGVPENEVLDVAEIDEGTAITTFDGVRYVVVPDDRPDFAGKTGLMLLAPPAKSYGAGFPVFAPAPAEEAAPEPGDAGPDLLLAAGGEVPSGTVTDVLDWVGTDPGRASQALAAEQAAENPRKTLISALESTIAGPPPEPDGGGPEPQA